MASYAGSVYHTLKRVFPVVRGAPGDTTIFFASAANDLISLDPQTLKARYLSLGKTFFDPEAFATILPKERTTFVLEELERSPAFINTDFAPISSSLAMILWGRFSGSDWMGILNTIRDGGLTVFLIPVLFFLLARISFRARWGPRAGAETRFQALLAMSAVGAGAMGVQIVLIYSYQSLFGYVFERIGLLAGVFMAGLAAGSYIVGEVLFRIRAKDKALVCDSCCLFALLPAAHTHFTAIRGQGALVDRTGHMPIGVALRRAHRGPFPAGGFAAPDGVFQRSGNFRLDGCRGSLWSGGRRDCHRRNPVPAFRG